MRSSLDPEILPELDDQIREEIFALLRPAELAAAVREPDTDDALDVISDLDEKQQRELLARLPVADRAELLQGLPYPEYSARRLPTSRLIALPADRPGGEADDLAPKS